MTKRKMPPPPSHDEDQIAAPCVADHVVEGKTIVQRKYNNWHPSTPDPRDKQFHKLLMRARLLPKATDLRAHDNPIYDQGNLGSCVGNGCGDCWEFALRTEGKPAPLPSRLFIYYFGRVMEGTVNSDSGLAIRDGLKVLTTYGCCDEKIWPYVEKQFKVKPNAEALAAAKLHKATEYYSVKQDLVTMKSCLADGFPIVGGFSVFSSFESESVAETGKVPVPKPNEEPLGGHCVVIVGYDDALQCFIVRNSWGTSWGDKGYCYMPYVIWTDPQMSSDFWTVRAVA